MTRTEVCAETRINIAHLVQTSMQYRLHLLLKNIELTLTIVINVKMTELFNY